LLPFPVSLMKLAGKLTGKIGAVNRLTGSLTVDSSKIRQELGWKPPFTMEQGLRETVRWFLSTKGTKQVN
jgi:nucleoside-diphosphate-sugar epimerase